jgi:hypothetical protein
MQDVTSRGYVHESTGFNPTPLVGRIAASLSRRRFVV